MSLTVRIAPEFHQDVALQTHSSRKKGIAKCSATIRRR